MMGMAFLMLGSASTLKPGLWPSLYTLYEACIQMYVLVNVPEIIETEIMSMPMWINNMWLVYINEKAGSNKAWSVELCGMDSLI